MIRNKFKTRIYFGNLLRYVRYHWTLSDKWHDPLGRSISPDKTTPKDTKDLVYPKKEKVTIILYNHLRCLLQPVTENIHPLWHDKIMSNLSIISKLVELSCSCLAKFVVYFLLWIFVSQYWDHIGPLKQVMVINTLPNIYLFRYLNQSKKSGCLDYRRRSSWFVRR